MPATSDTAALLPLARWAASLRYEQIPEPVRQAARMQVLDMVAALHAAARSHESHCVRSGLPQFAGPGRAHVLHDGSRCAPHDAALANAACSMAQDYDDIVWMGHTCHSAVFAPLAVAEHESAGAREFITAVVVATEIAGRLGASAFLGPLNGQMWTFIHLIGAAAGAATILNLTPEQTAHAMAIALAQPNFALQPGFMVPTSKLLAAATPTATGIQAAYFARAGMTGALDILEDSRGFWRRFSFLPLPGMLGGLGTFWALQTLTVKTYPGCHYFQTAVSAIDELEQGGRLESAAIESVHVETTKLGMEVSRFARSYTTGTTAIEPVNVNFDLGITLAIRILAGRLTSQEVQPEWLHEHTAAIRALQRTIRVVHAPELTLHTLMSARAVNSGADALQSIGLRDLWSLRQRYSAEYNSSLASPRELGQWLRAIWRSTHRPSGPRPELVPGTVPLYFPSRVTLRLRDGTVRTAQVLLPRGSVSSPQALAELHRKFSGEVAPSLGEAGAAEAWQLGLGLGMDGAGQDLATFVNACSGGR